MNLEQLEYIKEIVDTKSMSVAADNLHVTQSAISQSVSILEKEFGVQIFKRSRHGSFPTEAGLPIIKKILEILKKTEELKEEFQSMTSSYTGELKIATIPSIFMTFLPKALAKFKRDFPQIKVTIFELENDEVLDQINKNKVDLGLISVFNAEEQLRSPQLTFHPFQFQGSFHVIVSKDSILALHNELQLIDIKDYPFILYGRTFYHQLIEEFEKHYGPLNIVFESLNPEVIKKSVAEGLGISLLSSLMIHDDPYIETKRIIPIPLTGYPLNFNLFFGGIYSKERKKQYRLIKKFLEYFEG